MLSPLSTGVTSGENQDHLALWGTLGWAASHAVGAVAAIVAWVSTHRTGVSTWTVGLCVLHGILLLVAGTIAGVVLLISGSHFH